MVSAVGRDANMWPGSGPVLATWMAASFADDAMRRALRIDDGEIGCP
jgi:hypothetical protein